LFVVKKLLLVDAFVQFIDKILFYNHFIFSQTSSISDIYSYFIDKLQ